MPDALLLRVRLNINVRVLLRAGGRGDVAVPRAGNVDVRIANLVRRLIVKLFLKSSDLLFESNREGRTLVIVFVESSENDQGGYTIDGSVFSCIINIKYRDVLTTPP